MMLMAAIAALAMTMGSCGGKGNAQQQEETYDETERPEVWTTRDSTLYGLCGEGSAMNTLQLITDTGDTLEISVQEAQDQNHVLGGFSVGDRMAVLTNKERTKATLVINQTGLLGNWVMPDPIDGSDEIGISIREGGIAESIDNTIISYRTWRIVNGLLELTSVREGGIEEEESNLYEIISLGNDSLVYKTVGLRREEEQTFEYSRQVIKEHVDKVKLEEATFNDILM